VNAGPDQSVGCNATATLTSNVTGNIHPYTYQWSNGSKNQSINNAGAGVYIVTVNDGNCMAIDTAVVMAPANRLPHLQHLFRMLQIPC